MISTHALLSLPEIFSYPGEGYAGAFDRALFDIEACGRDLAEKLAPLAKLLGAKSTDEMQELYTRTFDINPQCTLEIGWHLFGEDYKRGAFLVRMRELMRAAGVEQTAELPDHIVHVLPVVALLSPIKADPFARRYVIPAIEKMLDGFADPENPFRPAVEAVRDLLVQMFGPGEQVPGDASAKGGPYDAVAPACGAPSFPVGGPVNEASLSEDL